MCGITGSTKLFLNEITLKKALASINYRGPDNVGEYKDDYVYLGHTRLSISDLTSDGNQPFKIKEYKDYILIYNGEIFNTSRLKEILNKKNIFPKTKCDTEILYLLLVNFGFKKTINLIEGMFAFAFYDKKNKLIWISRDHLGIKPLFFSLHNGFSFSSTIEGLSIYLRELKDSQLSINKYGIVSYLQFGYSLPKSQIYNEIEALLPGYFGCFDINKNNFIYEKWYEIPKLDKKISISKYLNSKKNILQKTDLILEEVINEQSISDAQGSIFLSGGIDSTLIATYINKNLIKKAYTLKYVDSNEFDESKIAEKIADSCGLDLKICEFNFFNYDINFAAERQLKLVKYPFANSTILSTDFLSNQASKDGIRMALIGDGGDELFGGYPRYKAMFLNELIKKSILFKLPVQAFKFIFDLVINYKFLKINKIINSKPNLERRLRALRLLIGLNNFEAHRISHLYFNTSDLVNSKFESYAVIKEFDSFFDDKINSPFSSMMADLQTWVPFNLNYSSDIASMNNNLEIRVPFLDKRILEFVSKENIPTLNLNQSKIILRKLLKKKGYKYISNLPKKGFNPPLKTLINSNITQINEVFYESKELLSRYINYEKLSFLLSEQREGKRDASRELWNAFVLAKWLQNTSGF